MSTLQRTKPVEIEATVQRARGVSLKTIRLTCACGVALTYCADAETFRKERNWLCYRCGGRHKLDI